MLDCLMCTTKGESEMSERPSLYDPSGLRQAERKEVAERVAKTLVPSTHQGSIYDLNHVADLTRQAQARRDIVRSLTGRL